MHDPIAWILLTLSTAWAVQALLAVIAQHKLAHRAARPQTQRYAGYRPPAVVIVPFKGVEPALRENLRGLFTQDYPDYRLMLIVESEDDPACPFLREAIEDHPNRQAELLVAGPADPDEGQKIHNLLAAVRKLKQDDAGETVWVFADSDAVPGPHWLGELVGPLAQERTAVTTGFRWLVPESRDGTSPPPFWARIASIINSSATGFIRREQYTHAWGGSMAMRVTTAEQSDLIGRWQGAISDDYQVTRMARDLERRVYFVPECLVASPVDYNLKELLNFAFRQYLITRVYAPGVYYGALLIHALYFAGLASTIALLFRSEPEFARAYAVGVLIWVFIANQVRATLRHRVVRLTLGPDVVRKLKPTFTLERWTTPLWLGINLLLLASALFGRTITWRGIRYRLDGPQSIRRL